VVLKAPKVPYRETIRGKADVQGRTKSNRRSRTVRRLQDQDGAHAAGGQLNLSTIFLAARFRRIIFPAIEKGIKDAAGRGYLAGFSGGGFPA